MTMITIMITIEITEFLLVITVITIMITIKTTTKFLLNDDDDNENDNDNDIAKKAAIMTIKITIITTKQTTLLPLSKTKIPREKKPLHRNERFRSVTRQQVTLFYKSFQRSKRGILTRRGSLMPLTMAKLLAAGSYGRNFSKS